jgi:hydrogenase maturation protease
MIADAHSLNPANVLQMLRSLGSAHGKLYLIGCEPEILDIEDGRIGLSEVVEAAIPQAIQLIKSLVNDLLSETPKLRVETA